MNLDTHRDSVDSPLYGSKLSKLGRKLLSVCRHYGGAVAWVEFVWCLKKRFSRTWEISLRP